jgi:hypothetical protein
MDSLGLIYEQGVCELPVSIVEQYTKRVFK